MRFNFNARPKTPPQINTHNHQGSNMLYGKPALLSSQFLVMATVVCGGCSPGSSAHTSTASGTPLGLQVPVLVQGNIDSDNRYLSTARVKTLIAIPGVGHLETKCSGVLVDNRVVITAAHCVCLARKWLPPEPPLPKGLSVVDANSTCAKTSEVEFTRYKPVENKDATQIPSDPIGPYKGAVYVNEEARMELAQRETEFGLQDVVLSSRADLAAIILDKSLEGVVKHVRLPKDENEYRINPNSKPRDAITMIGYGKETDTMGTFGIRRYGNNTFLSMSSDGSAFFVGTQPRVPPVYEGNIFGIEHLGPHTAEGDSGGPCFNKKDPSVLIGIASTGGLGVGVSSYTSVHKYLAWFRRMIEKAKAKTD